MKKILALSVVFIILFMTVYSCAMFSKVELNFKTVDNKQEYFDLYLLLPEDYIKFAMVNDVLNLTYEGPSTLKNNKIPGIDVKQENVQDEPYIEGDTEYVQILLEKSDDNSYKFDIIGEYPNLSMKYRIKNDKKDYIAHIDNFKIKNRICKIEYDYEKDQIKQSNEDIIVTVVISLITLVIILIIVVAAYIKQRR